jgi:hypothetical protein
LLGLATGLAVGAGVALATGVAVGAGVAETDAEALETGVAWEVGTTSGGSCGPVGVGSTLPIKAMARTPSNAPAHSKA